MKLRENHWLNQRLNAWSENNLITSEQAKAIRSFESAFQQQSRLSFPVLLSALGAISVALGIILIIAYNWEAIPRHYRLGGYFVLLTTAAEFTLRRWKSDGSGLIAGAIIWFMLPLAGIGLWGQIYQLSGDPLKPFLIWLGLGMPLVILIRKSPLATVFAAGIVFTLFATPWAGENLLHAARVGFTFKGWGLAVFLWLFAFWAASTRAGSGTRTALTWSWLIWLWAIGSIEVYGGLSDIVWPLMLAGLSILAWGFHRLWLQEEGEFPLSWTGIGLTSLTLYSTSFLWHTHSLTARYYPLLSQSWYPWAVSFSGVLLLLLFRLKKGGDLREWSLDFMVLFPLIPALFCCFEAVQICGILSSFLMLLWGVFLCWYGVQSREPKLVNMGVFLSGLLLITRFFDYFDTMFTSGLGFICAGCLVLGLSWVMNKSRKHLLNLVVKEESP